MMDPNVRRILEETRAAKALKPRNCRQPNERLAHFPRVLLWRPGARHLNTLCDACGCDAAFFVNLLARCAGCYAPIMPVTADKRWRIDGGMVVNMQAQPPTWNDLALVPITGTRSRTR